MSTTAVSLAEYLATSYRPDCDYVDGEVQERNLGEFDHSRLQFLIAMALGAQEQAAAAYTLTEQRVQVLPDRFRIPDVCLVRREDREPVIHRPPLVCVEVVSPQDTLRRMQARIDDYLAMGVPVVWVVDPETRRGYQYTTEGMRPANDGMLRSGAVTLDLAALFAQL